MRTFRGRAAGVDHGGSRLGLPRQPRRGDTQEDPLGSLWRVALWCSGADICGKFRRGCRASTDQRQCAGVAFLPFPLTIAIAILRDHLFDIDTILNRTLVYGGLRGIIVASYLVIVTALGTLFQAQGNLLISLVAAGVVAVLFQPLRSGSSDWLTG